jgi:hypothetical protein
MNEKERSPVGGASKEKPRMLIENLLKQRKSKQKQKQTVFKLYVCSVFPSTLPPFHPSTLPPFPFSIQDGSVLPSKKTVLSFCPVLSLSYLASTNASLPPRVIITCPMPHTSYPILHTP